MGIYVNEENDRFMVTEVKKNERNQNDLVQFMKNGDLLTVLRNTKTMQIDSLFQMARQAAAGMVYLEDKNIVHRDLALSIDFRF